MTASEQLNARLQAVETENVGLKELNAHLQARIEKMRRDHAEEIERTIQKMEKKVAARDYTIEALKDTIVKIAGDY